MTYKNSGFVTAKQLPGITGCSKSYFDKGRLYGYGPKFIRLNAGGKGCKVLYRIADVEAWLQENECQPGEFNDA